MFFFNKLKKKWGIASNKQFVIILIVFALTGSFSVKIAPFFLENIGFSKVLFKDLFLGTALYWGARILIIFPIYQLLLLSFGALFFQFRFFWNFEKKFFLKIFCSKK